MSNDTDPVEPEPAPAEPTTAAPARRTLRERFAGAGDRAYGVRGLIAATVAALIVGGIGGAAIHAAVEGPDHGRFDRGGFGPGSGPGGPDRGGEQEHDREGFGDERPSPPALPQESGSTSDS